MDAAISYVLDDPEFEFNYGQEILLYTKMFRPAFGPTQPTFQGAQGAGPDLSVFWTLSCNISEVSSLSL